MASRALAITRRLGRGLLAGSLVCLLTACSNAPDGSAAPAITVSWTIEPAPPAAGVETVTRFTLTDDHQQPVRGARLQLEGHMSHPGMAPVVGAVTERADGEYEARVQFTMAGDWILVVTGDLAGGGRLTKQIEIAGVRPAG